MAQTSDLVAREWFRYGKKRLYVNDEDGGRVGWVDLLTGERHLEVESRSEDFHALADAHPAIIAAVVSSAAAPAPEVETTPIEIPAAVEEPPIEDAPVVPEPPEPIEPEADAASIEEIPPPEWIDLATNLPGQAVRARAHEELESMRAKTRVGTWVARVFDMKTDERAFRVGADGEESVGARLEKLRASGWQILHSVPVGAGDSDIDHILIGPGGVFTLNTKNHPGGSVWVGRYAIKVNGFTHPYLRNSRFEAKRAAKLLSAAVGWPVEVTPALIFLTGSIIPRVTIRQEPDDVRILDRMDLPGYFKRRKGKLDAEQVAAIYEQARRSTIWHK